MSLTGQAVDELVRLVVDRPVLAPERRIARHLRAQRAKVLALIEEVLGAELVFKLTSLVVRGDGRCIRAGPGGAGVVASAPRRDSVPSEELCGLR